MTAYTAQPVDVLQGFHQNTSQGWPFTAGARSLIISMWVTMHAATPWIVEYGNGSTGHGGFICQFENDNCVISAYQNADFGGGNNLIGGSTFTTGADIPLDTLTHMLLSMDSLTGTVQLYLDDHAISASSVSWPNSGVMQFQPGDIMGFGSGPGNLGDACISDLFVATSQSVFDLTIIQNRRKFIDFAGGPVYLGPDGSFPLGSRPQVFLTTEVGAAPASWYFNRGSGGPFVPVVIGGLCDAFSGADFAPPLLPANSDFTPAAFDVLQMITTNGPPFSSVHWIERTTKTFDVTDTIDDAWFLDSAVVPTAIIDQTTSLKLYGFWHIRGVSNVSAFISGFDCGTYTVSAAGTITVPFGSDPDGLFTHDVWLASSKKAVVGFAYPSQGQMLRPGTGVDAGSANGPPLGKTRRAHMYGALMVNAIGVSFGTAFTTVRAAQFKTPGGTPYNKNQMFTGVHWDTLEDNYSFDSMVCWQVTRPYPVTIASVAEFLQTQDR